MLRCEIITPLIVSPIKLYDRLTGHLALTIMPFILKGDTPVLVWDDLSHARKGCRPATGKNEHTANNMMFACERDLC